MVVSMDQSQQWQQRRRRGLTAFRCCAVSLMLIISSVTQAAVATEDELELLETATCVPDTLATRANYPKKKRPANANTNAINTNCKEDEGMEWACAEAGWTPGVIERDLGVAQRVDGSEEEREAVRDVISDMEYYYDMEVERMPESVKRRCKNTNELCAFWASAGECESNRGFMRNNCPAACRLCWLVDTEIA